MHEAVDGRTSGKLPRLVYPSNQQQQQQQQQEENIPLRAVSESEYSFPDSFVGAGVQGPLFV
jgi:hypothetical protein